MASFSFFLQVLLWGLSWLAITFQQGEVAAEVSIFYRFAIAAICLWCWGIYRKSIQAMNHTTLCWSALLGLCLFCCNFLAFYYSTHFIVSGLTATIMATAPILNAINNRLFFGKQIHTQFWLGALIGLFGVALLFFPELANTNMNINTLIGASLALLGTLCFSFGNMLSIRLGQLAIKPYTANCYAMTFGCGFLLILILFLDIEFSFDSSFTYIGGLLYLAIPASVFGFTLYLQLVDKIGASQAAYALVITPFVALLASSMYEGYNWNMSALFGAVLIIIGHRLAQLKGAGLVIPNIRKLVFEIRDSK